ncbi:MAG: DUF2333 family protein [Rickettsiales bacterium]|nr:DUF2333 family protein [Rickettsiales bacterium]
MKTALALIGLRLKEWFLLLPASFLKRAASFFILILLILIPLSMIWVHEIDDSSDLNLASHLPDSPQEMVASHSVATAIALIEREMNTHHWAPNDPWFFPGAWLDRMPAYQRGITAALSRFAIEMSDQIGRTRGSSRIDEDLDNAAGLMKYPPDVWMWNPSVSFMPTASSEKQYRGAMKAFRKYNERLAKGEATFEARADNLQQTLERIASDIGSASAAIAERIDGKNRPYVDLKADELYYDIKGKMYAYHMLLKAMRYDFAKVIDEKQVVSSWDQMEESMRAGAELSNIFILNNAPDSQVLPNHLTAMGFYLLRARTQLKEISSILLK